VALSINGFPLSGFSTGILFSGARTFLTREGAAARLSFPEI